MPRFTRNCIWCGAKNSKRSSQGVIFKCRSCGEVNFGPGSGRILAQMSQATAISQKQRAANKVTAITPLAGQQTVIKSAKPATVPKPAATPAKPAPKVKPAAPAAVKPVEKKASLFERIGAGIYG